MSPILLLWLLAAVSVAAAAVSALRHKGYSAKLAALAATWGMRFTAEDRFQLAPRVAIGFPTAGAADVLLRDLIYQQEDAGFRYLFTVEYTLGVLRTKRRRTGAGMVVETGVAGEAFSAVTLAPADLPLGEQYTWLWRTYCARSEVKSETEGVNGQLDAVGPPAASSAS
jgi:hypothetical protein